jgi:hypothetical protein
LRLWLDYLHEKKPLSLLRGLELGLGTLTVRSQLKHKH